MLIYNSTNVRYEAYKNSAWSSVGGGGSGGINYISDANSDLSDASIGSWVPYDDGASATPVNGTDDLGGTGDNQLSTPTVDTTTKLRGANSLKLVKAAANAQGEGYSVAYTSHEIDKNSLQEITFNFDCSNANYTAGDVVVYIYDITNSTLITPSQTSVPAGKGTFKALFVNGNSNSYRLILHYAGSNTSAQTLYFDNFMVGPVREGNVGGVPVTEWQSYTPTVTGPKSDSVMSTTALYRRVGDTIEIQVYSSVTTIGSGSNTAVSVTIPSGLTINTAKISSTDSSQTLGTAQVRNNATSVYYTGNVLYSTATVVRFINYEGNSGNYWDSTRPITWANGDRFSAIFRAPISEWAGETVSMANSRVSYSYNTSTSTTASDTTSFGYGSSGAQIQSITASLSRRVRFQTAILDGDRIAVEVSGTDGKWLQVGPTVAINMSGSSYGIMPFTVQNTTTYGIRIDAVNGSTTDVDVQFGTYRYSNGATFGAAGAAWSDVGTGYWRLVKSSNPLGIGTGLATATTPGAYAAGMAPGATNGAAIAAGYVGEVKTKYKQSASSQNISAATWTNLTDESAATASLDLTAGVWFLQAQIILGGSVSTADNAKMIAISEYSGSTGTDHVSGSNVLYATSPTIAQDGFGNISYVVNNSASKTYYFKIYLAVASATTVVRFRFNAIRIA
jgi:hypothetical protein